MNVTNAQTIALAYHQAFERKDRGAVRKLLADHGDFIGPLTSFKQADRFLEAADLFMQLTERFTVKKVLAEGDDVCIFWDYKTIVPSIPVTPVAEWFKIEAGKIKYIQLHFNAAPFVAAMERGEVKQALESRGRN